MKNLLTKSLFTSLLFLPTIFTNQEHLVNLFSKKAEFRETNFNKELIKAAESGNLKEVRFIINHLIFCNYNCTKTTTDINVQDLLGDTPLIKAAKNGHIRIVESLIWFGKADTSKKNNEGRTAMMEAAKNNQQEVARFLESYSSDSWHLKDIDGYRLVMLKVIPPIFQLRRD